MLLLGLVNAGCLNFRPPPEPVPAEVAGTPPDTGWTSRAGRGFTDPLASADSVLYGAGWDRRVYAVALADGRQLWGARISGPVVGGVVARDSFVYAATGRPDGRLYAVRRRDGDVRWRASTGRTIVPIAVEDDLALVHSQEGVLSGVNARTGRIEWRRALQTARSAPLFADGGIIATSIDSIYRLDRSGTVTLRRRLPGAVLGGWTRQGDALVGGTADSTIVALDPATLEARWTRRVDAPVFNPPIVYGDTLVAVSRTGTVWRLVGRDDPRIERVVDLGWPVTAPPVRHRGTLVLGGADGTLRGYDDAGREQWRRAVWRPVDVAPVVVDDALIAVGGNGDIYRLEP